MIRGRQSHVLPLVSDPSVTGARCTLLDGPDGPQPYTGSDALARYVVEGPLEPPERRDDGSGSLLVEVDAGTVRVDVPAGATWVDLRPDWSADDEDDLAADIGPADPLGGVIGERMALGPAGRRALLGDLQNEVAEWLAAHHITLDIGPAQVTADPGADGEREVRRESALRDLSARLARHVDAPGVAGRLAAVRAAAKALDEHPLGQTLADVFETLDQTRPIAEADLEPVERRAWRNKRKRDRRYQRELARRCLVRFIGPGWEDVPPGRHFEVFETDAPAALRDRIVRELVAHVGRIATRLPPKPRRGSSPASG